MNETRWRWIEWSLLMAVSVSACLIAWLATDDPDRRFWLGAMFGGFFARAMSMKLR